MQYERNMCENCELKREMSKWFKNMIPKTLNEWYVIYIWFINRYFVKHLMQYTAATLLYITAEIWNKGSNKFQQCEVPVSQ